MSYALVGLGSNLGDRQALIDCALVEFAATPGIRIVARSGSFETAPVGGPARQSPYLNAAATLETSLGPAELLARMQQIELDLGRDRSPDQIRWQARTIDLDLLLYDEQVIDTPTLVVPHPRLAFRRFVLEPAAEIAGDWRHPTVGWTIGELLAHLNRSLAYVAITGPPGVGKTRLAEIVAAHTGARFIADPIDSSQLVSYYADPSGHAESIEIQFLSRRAALLATDRWDAANSGAISDFWIGQTLAYAATWLASDARAVIAERWQAASAQVVKPKLLIALDAPAETLAERLRRRGRPYEQGLGLKDLARLREALRIETARPGLGPVLRLSSANGTSPETEALAAWEASQ